MAEQQPREGRCLCGAVTYAYEGQELWRGHCHCESCRRATASAFTTFMGVARETFRYTGRPPKVFRSSPGVARSFCDTCGTPIAYESEAFPGEIHLYAATLLDSSDFRPDFHVHHAEKVPWVELDDDLPRHPHSSDEG